MNDGGEIGEDAGYIFSRDLEGEGGQKAECIVGTNSEARDGAIGEDDNGGNSVDVLLNLSGNTFHVEFVLLTIAGVSKPRCIEDANLREGLFMLIMFKTQVLTTTPCLLVNS